MKTLLAGIFLWAACLSGQTAENSWAGLRDRVAALLSPSRDRAVVARQLTDTMMLWADADRRPSQRVVEDFAKELAYALAGRKLSGGQVADISTCILVAMKGVATNLESTDRMRKVLGSAGIPEFEIRGIVSRFLAIGEDVRGPDDFRISKAK